MCELIYINLGSQKLNQLAAFNISVEDTRVGNYHGWGIFSSKTKSVFKTKLMPMGTMGYGLILADQIGKGPTMMHVRAASKGAEVKDEFNHPFETENLVLAHNGTLELLDDEEAKKVISRLDSEVFLAELEAQYKNIPASESRMVKALNLAMAKFTGKFAFLIYEKPTGTWYAVRGSTANLFFAYTHTGDKPIPENITGYIINTEKDDLARGIDLAMETYQLMTKLDAPSFSAIGPLKEETIYRLDPTSIVKIGSIKQNTRPILLAKVDWKDEWRTNWRSDERATGMLPNFPPYTAQTGFEIAEKAASNIVEWLDIYGLTMVDFDEIVFQSLGIPLIAVEPEDIDTIKKYIIPKLFCNKEFRLEMVKLIDFKGRLELREVMAEKGFQFPYMLESNRKGMIAELKKKKG